MVEITDINQKIMNAVTGVAWLKVIGWIFFILIIIGGGFWVYTHYKNKKLFNKRITAFEIIGNYWQPALRDVAKVVKIGKGGFEILYLKNQKTWKIAYGGRVGKNDYYFFIMPDGYWYNSMLYADINAMDDKKGLIPVVTTNPLMRGQYTALEKQIDKLTGEKTKWWDKYGSFILSIAFILIAGVLLWLMFREFSKAMGLLSDYNINMNELLNKVNTLFGNIQSQQGGSGLIPVS